jgi:hypothetical protein
MQAFDKASSSFSNILTTLKPDLLSSSFSNILTTLKPDLLICDFFQPWALALALSLNIPTVQFVISGNEANSVAVHALKNSGNQSDHDSLLFKILQKIFR